MPLSTPRPVAVPESVPTGTSMRVGIHCFTATRAQSGARVWVGESAALGPSILLHRGSGHWLVAPWLEAAAPRALSALIRSGALVPPNPQGALSLPTVLDDPEDAAMRVAVIEALLETRQVHLDDALTPLRRWRALRDGGARTPRSTPAIG